MYTRWYDTESIESIIAHTYSDGKDFIFRMFFGWRECHNNQSKYIFSRKDWETIEGEINFFKKIKKNA